MVLRTLRLNLVVEPSTQGAVGGTSTGLTALSINATAETGTIEIANIGAGATVGVTGQTDIGNSATQELKLDGTLMPLMVKQLLKLNRLLKEMELRSQETM